MVFPDWIPPQTSAWYENLALETGGYNYPWKSVFDEPRAEVVFADQISSYIHEDYRILDVGCGHGDFTKLFSNGAKDVVGCFV